MSFFTKEKEQELINVVKAEGFREKGFRKFAEKHGVTAGRVRTHFYQHMLTPELDRELPSGAPRAKDNFFTFTKEKEQELINIIKAEGSRGKGLKKFAEKHGISRHRAKDHFYQHMLTPELDRELPKGVVSPKTPSSCTEKNNQKPANQELPKFKPTRPPKITVEGALHNIIKEKGEPLTMDDIETAAQKAGVHYHVALSTLGSMTAKGKIKISKELENERTKLTEQLVIENMVDWETPEDVDSLIKQLQKETGLNEAEAHAAIINVFHKPECKAWGVQLNEYRKEIRLLKLKIKDLQQTKEPVKTETQTITVEHILNLYEIIDELKAEVAALKNKLQASRKTSLATLELFRSKTANMRRQDQIAN